MDSLYVAIESLESAIGFRLSIIAGLLGGLTYLVWAILSKLEKRK